MACVIQNILTYYIKKNFIWNIHKKNNIKSIKKITLLTKTENTFYGKIGTSCLIIGSARIPQINPNHYSMPRIIVIKFQKDLST